MSVQPVVPRAAAVDDDPPTEGIVFRLTYSSAFVQLAGDRVHVAPRPRSGTLRLGDQVTVDWAAGGTISAGVVVSIERRK